MARFYRVNVYKLFAVPTITLTAPTAAQVNAGLALNTTAAGLVQLRGFKYSNSPIDVPDQANLFVPSIPGRNKSEASGLDFYEDSVTNALQATLAQGVVTNIVIFYAGTATATPAAADKCDIWPVISNAFSREYAPEDAAKWMVDLTPSASPVMGIALV